MKTYEFNPDLNNTAQPELTTALPVVNLACANGFLPQTYVRALQPLLVTGRYRCVSIYARPMWGDCPPESLVRWEQLGDDLLQGLDELQPPVDAAQKVIGIGHSVGGIATIYAAVKQPERFRCVVLLDPTFLPPWVLRLTRLYRWLGRGDQLPLVQGALHRRRTWESTDAAYHSFRQKPLFTRWPDDVLRAYAESMTAPGSDGKVHLTFPPEWESQIYKTIDVDAWKLPARLTVPTLVLRGELTDTFKETSERLFRQRNPRAEMMTVKGVGHLLPQEHPDEVGRLIADFVQRQ